MNRTLLLKLVAIVVLLLAALWTIYPPSERLRAGLDLAGGTSLVYDIDTGDLDKSERKGLAERMIPILRKRIDPKSTANLVIRPQSDTRIEIQLPLASADTIAKRDVYENALEQLEKDNLNLLFVTRALKEKPEKRAEIFAEFANGNETRQEILENLAKAYDARKAAQDERDKLMKKLDKVKASISASGLDMEEIEQNAIEWSKLDSAKLKSTIGEFVETDQPDSGVLETLLQFGKPKAKELIEEYVEIYSNWAQVVNDLANPETGKNVVYKKAVSRLNELNLNIEQLMDILEMAEKSAARAENLDRLKERFPERKGQIDAVIEAYAEYSEVGGRLDDPEDLKRMLKGSGVLEFRILPTRDTMSPGEIQSYLESLEVKGPRLASTNDYIWVQIEDINNWKRPDAVVGLFGDTYYVLASNKPSEAMLHNLDDKWKLNKAYPTIDERGTAAIGFRFDQVAASLFYNLTKNNINKPLCILLDDTALSAPNINSAISSQGIITGKFTQTEQEDMINKLNAGSFPARLSEVPISEKSIGSLIGADNRDKGIQAGIYGLIAVAIFMILYYLFPGLLADIALLMNIVFILCLMVVLSATFTLPGIAGIILTIGMSVDANVLIFERIREEQDKGNSLRTAIANGYQRAFRTIFDANLTTFITALILYAVASEEIKGFAIVLMLGILSSMFTALVVTRVIFDLLIEMRIIRDHLKMQLWIHRPNINWMGLRSVFFTVSALLIIGGLFVFFNRDEETNSKYDIEFTGGTSIQVNFKEGTNYSRADVETLIREKGSEYKNPALMAARVNSVGNSGLQYEITTTATNKTKAQLRFTDAAAADLETIEKTIKDKAADMGRTLFKLSVEPTENQEFIVSISGVNERLLENILTSAFPNATVSETEVDEIVSRAVREAFPGVLSVRENLGLAFGSTSDIDESVIELPNYIGGIMIECTLSQESSAAEIRDRLKNIRFKPDSQDLAWYKYDLINTDLSLLNDEDRVSSFAFITVHPEAGYRELSSDEKEQFINNEKEKIMRACSLETSLARVTQIDPSIGGEAKNRALAAIVLSLLAIVGYIWIRFGNARYGFAAIAALIHDVCITLGAVTLCTYIAQTSLGKALGIGDFKINLEMIAAFLTIIGYSLNDTIVVFDRIRENRGKLGTIDPSIVSTSLNQTLSRTLLTSFTTFLVVLVMYIWGGAGLRGFTFALLVGIIIGTYSSIAIASPILLIGKKNDRKKHA